MNESLNVFSAINNRLILMTDVAQYKLQNRLQIEDIKREVIIVNNAIQYADDFGLEAESVEFFFQVQMSTAKVIQYRHITEWLNGNVTRIGKVKDLDEEIRPILTKQDYIIIDAIKCKLRRNGQFTDKDKPLFMSSLTMNYLSKKDKELIFHSLRRIKLK